MRFLFASLLALAAVSRAHASCTAPANPVEAENCLPGSPPSEWNIAGDGDTSIEGFTTEFSVNKGETVSFKVNSPSTARWHIDVYRLGFYGGNGARKIATLAPSTTG